ncbi:MAG: alpha-hydroxy-acid oxidizing protein [Acidobacteria bacterium]|nr:alpha-hydroxy-acid oxidizing protein [Acidobacteriota bacterium]
MIEYRRQFLRFLAGSPLSGASWAQSGMIANPKDAINVMDFEAVARKVLPPAHFGYMATGVIDDATLRANREGMDKFYLRPRRLVNVEKVDTSVTLFGTRWETPLMIMPVGSQKAFHTEGEVAVARAGNKQRVLQILSTVTNSSVEEVTKAAGRPIWYQLYTTSSWSVTERLVKRAENAGCPVLVFTVDLPAGRSTETEKRMRKLDTRKCEACHDTPQGPGAGFLKRKPMFDGIEMKDVPFSAPSQTWAFVDKLKASTKMKLVLKGITTAEDGVLCREHGVDGIVVSNHGGRAEESGRSSIESLAEVVEAVGSAMPVMVDGGFRRGVDVFKALALGARAVGIGRPYIWGLAAFGQAGVEQVLTILRAELELAMRQFGAPSLNAIHRGFVARK